MAIISIGSDQCIRQGRQILEMQLLSKTLSFRFGRFVSKKMAFKFVKRRSIFTDIMSIMSHSLRNNTASLHVKPNVCSFLSIKIIHLPEMSYICCKQPFIT